MSTQAGSSLTGVRLKMSRAAEHLSALRSFDGTLASIKCEAVFTRDQERNLGYFVVQLPKPPLEWSTVVGDCLQNQRTALDYMVWQSVTANAPSQPGKKNMFPICSTEKDFVDQLKRGRLSGLTEQGIKIVTRVQPFSLPSSPLGTLSRLCNADKHRDLHLTLAVATDLDISYSRDGEVYLRTVLGNDEVRDGAVLGNVGIPLDMVDPQLEVQVHGDAQGFLAFRDLKDAYDDSVGVVSMLTEIQTYVADEVLSPMTRLIERA
jgi:hypothetical protein